MYAALRHHCDLQEEDDVMRSMAVENESVVDILSSSGGLYIPPSTILLSLLPPSIVI